MKPAESVIPPDELDRMMGLDPTADPYGPRGVIGYLKGDITWLGSRVEFAKIVEGIEVRQVAGVVSHITGIGWKNDLDLGLALLMEAQGG